MRTATIQREVPAAKSEIRCEASVSSESTRVTFSPLISRSILA